MIKFLGKKLEEEEAGKIAIKELNSIIEQNEQLCSEIQTTLNEFINKANNAEVDPLMIKCYGFALNLVKNITQRKMNKENKKWTNVKYSTNTKKFLTDVEKSVKSKDQAINGMLNAINDITAKYPPVVAINYIGIYQNLANWSLKIYKEQKVWAEENFTNNKKDGYVS